MAWLTNGSRFKKDGISPEFTGAVDSLDEGSHYTGTETVKRKTQLCQTCKMVLIQMLIL
jgi:hypothetical protein